MFLLVNVPHQASLAPSCPHPHDTSHSFVPLLPNKDKYVHIIRYFIGMTNILLCFPCIPIICLEEEYVECSKYR